MRNVAITILKILVSVCLISLLLYKIGVSSLIAEIKSANLLWIIVALLIFTFSNILGSFQWQLLLKARGIELSFARVIAYYYVGLFFNNFLVGYIGGDAFRIYDVRKVSHDTSGAVSAVTFDRFIGFFVLTTMGLIAAIIGFDLVKSGSIILSASIIFIGWMLTIIFLFKKNLMSGI